MIDVQMSNASAEVSSIVRGAITKKLEEMGEDIDEELPDYILLMIGRISFKFIIPKLFFQLIRKRDRK